MKTRRQQDLAISVTVARLAEQLLESQPQYN